MIGREVRRRREELGLTGVQLATRAGMAPSAVSQIETGKRTPSSTSVVKLAEALGSEVGDLYPKQGALFSPDDPPVGRGADESEQASAELSERVVGLLMVLNEALYEMEQAYAPGRELDWGRQALEQTSAIIGKAALICADAGLAGGGTDAFVEAVQIVGRAKRVQSLLDARAAEAPSRTDPLPPNVIKLRGEVEEWRRSGEEHLERAG